MIALADLLSFVDLLSQADDLALQLSYYLLQFVHFVPFLVVFGLVLVPDGLDTLLLGVQLLHLLGLLLQLVLLAEQLSLQLHLMVDIQLLHLEQQLLIIRDSLDQPPNALHDLPCLLLVLTVLLVPLVEGIEQHAEELPGFDAEVVVYVDVGVDEEVDLRDGWPVF